MAGMIKSVVGIWVIVVVFLVVVAPRGEAAVGCGTVVSSLNPCLPYLTNNAPLGGCCSGVKSLNEAAKTPADRQSVCNCLKSLAGSYPGPVVAKAAGLPGQCGVNIPYKISPSTDCSTDLI